MKKTISMAAIFLLLAGMAIADDASPSTSTSSTTTTVIRETTTTTEPIVILEESTTTIPPGAVPVLISANEDQAKTFCSEHGNGNPTYEDINGTSVGFCTLPSGIRCGLLDYMNGVCPAPENTTTTTIVNETTTTIPVPPTIPELPTELPPQAPTTTIPETTTTLEPVCGNMYQEVGEECDTTPSSCGAGRWECSPDCKCLRMPDIANKTSESPLGDVKIPESVKNIDPIYIVAGIVVVIIAIVAIIWAAGSDKTQNQKKDGQ